MNELAVIVVSSGSAAWLGPCLASLRPALDGVDADVVVCENRAPGETRAALEPFPWARLVDCENRGFAHANNRGLQAVDARYVLFLNPDTELVDGSFRALVDELDARPDIGAAGVRQLDSDGALYATARYAPNALRALGTGLSSERFRGPRRWLGERELRLALYDRELECDWVVGSFLLVRRAALEAAGRFDERFFLYLEETDLCLRIGEAGWRVVHLPSMTIVHHFEKSGGGDARLLAQGAFAQRQYASKRFSGPHRAAYLGAWAVGYALRTVTAAEPAQRSANRRALLTVLGLRGAPFAEPPRTAAGGQGP